MDAAESAPRDLRLIAVIGAAVLVAGLGALLWLDPARAQGMVVENGPVEWAQAVLLSVGLMVILRRAIQRLTRDEPAAPELLLAALLTVGIAAELSLHSRAGFRILHWRFSLRASADPILPWVALSVCLSVAMAVALHLARHRRSLVRVIRSLPHSGWGQLAIAGAVGYAAVQLFQHALARFMPRPSYFLEESIELVSAFYLCLAAWQLARVGASGEGSGDALPPPGMARPTGVGTTA